MRGPKNPKLRRVLKNRHLAKKIFIYVKAPVHINSHTKFQLGFSKFQFFNRQNGQEGATASLCQILSKSLEPRPRYGDFSIFQDGGRRHLGFSKFEIFNIRNGQDSRGSNCITVPNFVEIARSAAKICEFQYYASLA